MKKLFLPILIILAIITMLYLNSKNIDASTYLDLNEQLIDKTIELNNDYNKDLDYIAVDAYSFGVVNDKDIDLLVEYLKKYNVDIIIGRKEMINTDEFITDGKYNGIFITADNIMKESNIVEIEVKEAKIVDDYKTSKYKATYYLNKWHINNIINK